MMKCYAIGYMYNIHVHQIFSLAMFDITLVWLSGLDLIPSVVVVVVSDGLHTARVCAYMWLTTLPPVHTMITHLACHMYM